MSADIFDFTDLSSPEREVRYKGKVYKLREASEGAWSKFQGVIDRNRRFDPETGKLVGFDVGYAEADAALVAGCLVEVDGSREIPVLVETVREWPHRVVDPLVEWVKEVSNPPISEEQVPKS